MLLVSESFFISHELRRLHYDLENQLTPVAQLLAFQSRAALTFEDQLSGQELLRSISHHSSIIAAYCYTADSHVFAMYQKTPSPSQQLAHLAIAKKAIKNNPLAHDFQLVNGEAHILHPITIDDGVLGRIHLVDDLSSFDRSVQEFLWLSVMVVTASLFLAFLLAAQLPKIIAAPILSLKQLMMRVSRERSYHLRAYKYHNDELGELVEGFNTMLHEVEQRDRALAGYNERLEQDVTRRTQQLRHSIQALEIERDRAEAANRAKSAFLAAMSHEIRTPMNGVLGMLSLLRNTHLSGQQQRYAQMAHHSAETLLAIINDILDFSKIEAGQLHLEKIPFDLRHLLEETVLLFAEPIEHKGLHLHCDSDPGLAPAYHGDPTRLRQILFNLLGNAIKFTEHGDIYVLIKRLDEHYLNFRVEDSGIGIPKEKQAHIFNAFTQADTSTTRQYGGTGLGLTICKQLIHLMGGEMGVHSQPGEGATFWFTLPLSPASAEAQELLEQQAQNTLPPLELPARQVAYHILLAEDNPVNQEVAKAELESLGCHVSIAQNGREAFDLYQKKQFELILMDCEMPELDGFQATEVIRRYEQQQVKKPHIPIIALTANAVIGSQQACMQAGMDGYLSKPFTREQLLDILRPWLNNPQPMNAASNTPPDTVDIEQAMSEQDMLEQKKIDKLRRLQPQMLDKIIHLYLQHSSEQMLSLETAFAEQDHEQLGRISHSLKSASLNVGAVLFSKLCKAVELHSKQELPLEEDRFLELKKVYQATVVALKDTLEHHQSG